MSDHCGFCETHRPVGGTNMLIVGDGSWLEFCTSCGDTETLTNKETGEVITVRALFDRCSEGEGSLPDPAFDAPDLEVPPDVRLMMGDNPAHEEFPRDDVLPMDYDRPY